MATFSNNITIKIKTVASGGYGLAADEYAECSYLPVVGGAPVTFIFGSSSTIPATVTNGTFVYNFYNGVVFKNSP